MYYRQLYESPLGPLSLVASEKGLRGIWFVGQQHAEKGISGSVFEQPHPILDLTERALTAYFAGREVDWSPIPLDLQGTAFQLSVWRLLETIPYGQTTTYGQLAQRLGISSSQAVGGAVGRNPFLILIPCHRVVGQKGQLTGYAGGLDKKEWLLSHERARKEPTQ